MARKNMPPTTESIEEIESKWVKEYGETFKNYDEAGRLLGICHDTVVRLVKQGHLRVTPMKRILVRSAVAWAYGLQPSGKKEIC